MNEQQAREVRKLKVEQNCSYPTIARKFYEEFGETEYCNKNNAESLLYFDLDNVAAGPQVHNLTEGSMQVKSYKLVEYLFSPDTGKSLCLVARAQLDELPGDSWSDLDYSEEYEEGLDYHK